MTVAQITPPAPRTDALAGHAYCLPVVRELPVPAADPAGDRSWYDLARRRQRPDVRPARSHRRAAAE